MKSLFIFFLALFLFTSCKSKGKQLAEQVQTTLNENMPGSIPVKEGGWSMHANVKGKNWVAGSMMPTEATSRIIGYSGKDYISLPYDSRYFVLGKKITFTENNAVDLSLDGDNNFWAGRKGEMEITKLDDHWAEGTFYFTATTHGSDQTIEVTNGSFRIPLP